MPTPHNEANLEDISKTVIMPGDPLRAKYIAENFLENVKLVNKVRGMYAFTGNYKGKKITVMASGMGIPSMGIYCYELFKLYNVENIIRIGSCGAYKPEIKLFDIILSESVYTEGNFAHTLNNEDRHIIEANKYLNEKIIYTASKNNINLIKGNTICIECFDPYITDINKFLNRIPKNFNPIGCEMEAFALFYTAHILNKKASCLTSVTDSKYIKDVATPKERQTGLNNMIKLALDTTLIID